MIPSDHFVRYYNEVFKAMGELGREHLQEYWRAIGRIQTQELGRRFAEGGLQACYDYWKVIKEEENCEADLALTDDYFELKMHKCPSLSKVLDNDAAAIPVYCDHCMGWIAIVMEAAGLYAVMDMHSRTEPHCHFRVYTDKAKADAFESEARLPSRPYDACEQA